MYMQANPVEIIKKEIYIIKNDINSKVYIGQAINSKERFVNHCKQSAGKKSDFRSIDYAILKYGKKHFWFEIIKPASENYNENEIACILEYNSLYPNGYNLTEGGEEPPRKTGENHPNSKISNEQFAEIIILLKNTTMSLSQIGKKYNISKKQILRINQGTTRIIPGQEYPIRKTPNMNGKLTEKDIDEIIHLLKESYLFSGEIAQKYGVKEHIISHINNGTLHPRENEKYPIRNWKSCGVRAFTYEQVTEIIERLKHDTISIHKLSKEYNVDANVIYMINSGTSKKYRRENEKYPIRPF